MVVVVLIIRGWEVHCSNLALYLFYHFIDLILPLRFIHCFFILTIDGKSCVHITYHHSILLDSTLLTQLLPMADTTLRSHIHRSFNNMDVFIVHDVLNFLLGIIQNQLDAHDLSSTSTWSMLCSSLNHVEQESPFSVNINLTV